tara:strand:- start:1 stop:447 length:447 start_codon:yes stop_codon:yes gene_type:complete
MNKIRLPLNFIIDIYDFSRLVLALVFIIASISKILDPLSFSNIIDNYHVTPISINNMVALFLPWVELFIGLGFLFDIYTETCSKLSIALLIWFIFILSLAYYRGININCGCFSVDQGSSSSSDILNRIFQDIVFLVLSFIVKIRAQKV